MTTSGKRMMKFFLFFPSHTYTHTRARKHTRIHLYTHAHYYTDENLLKRYNRIILVSYISIAKKKKNKF